jgi:hypothetical protein
VPQVFTYTFTTAAAGGVCGSVKNGGAGGTTLASLTCGGLNIGGGAATVPEGPTPDGASTRFEATCMGSSCVLGPIATGDPKSCSDTGCPFGTFLSISNGPLSTCVNNTFATSASGTLDLATGQMSAGIPLSSEVTVTGNAAEPCPPCSGAPGPGTCDGTAANPGAICTGVNTSGDSYECLPSGSTLPPFGVDQTPAVTESLFADTAGTGDFCSATTGQATPGCFAEPDCDYIEASGMPAGAITPGIGHTIRLASIFCIPKTGNLLVDGAANLPGPGEVTLPANGILSP